MCIRPSKLSDGTLVACRKCWQCRENKISDWVGRCIAESETAVACNAITLTYGRDMRVGGVDHERAAVLTYSDVQKYIKLLRKHRYPLRYFAVGEYGSTKGRSHWHVVIFWQDRVPPHKLTERLPGMSDAEKEANTHRFMEDHWPHGWSTWEKPSAASIRYVCKYIQKDLREAERQGHVAMSKKPPLGHAYFVRLARRYVEQGLAPQDPIYKFAHVHDENGIPEKFYLSGVSLDLFCRSYVEQWEAVHGGHPPHSPLIEAYCDKVAKRVPDLDLRPFRPRGSYPWIEPAPGAPILFSESLNCYYSFIGDLKVYWSFDLEGNRAWQEKIRTETTAAQDRASILRDAARYRSLSSGD